MLIIFKSKESNDWTTLLPDFARHEYVLTHWLRQKNVERVPTVVSGLILHFSMEAEQTRIRERISAANLRVFIRLSLKYQWWQILNQVWRWCYGKASPNSSNRVLVSLIETLKTLRKEDFLELLKKDQFYLKEECIFIIAVEWCKYQIKKDFERNPGKKINPHDYAKDLLEVIRFPLMSQRFLSSYVYESGLLSNEELLSVFVVLNESTSVTCRFNSKPRYFLRNGVRSQDEKLLTDELSDYLDWLEGLTINTECQVSWNNIWWNAVVIDHNPQTDRLKINYPGWDPHWQQWIYRYSGLFRPSTYSGSTTIPDSVLTPKQLALKQDAQNVPYLQQ